jgi:hypothetical protein
VDALTLEERDHGFLWVQNVRNSQQFQAITEESTQYIFEQKVPLMDFSALTQKGFHFFEYFFRYVNWFLKRFDQGDNGVFRVLNPELVGIDNAWRAAIEPKDDGVAMQAIEFLNKLHKTVHTLLWERGITSMNVLTQNFDRRLLPNCCPSWVSCERSMWPRA